ncbi:hypothetical protein LQD23_03690 [Chromobacterium violaceum]|uniref:hypothetical protein n=1 Tax=Chromobacterium violaceum TaxID=536 RepID=UPI001E5E91FB|nr:hypothetical protein [Chromobacterium violaceum]MCD0491395.1 hypothetical protein [Chromobacterium violaceum]
MRLDRELQLAILKALAKRYPHRFQSNEIEQRIRNEIAAHADTMEPNICYLEELGLIDLQKGELNPLTSLKSGNFYKITAKGLDFLQNDGGLSAILGTVTVKLHADTIRDILEAKIMASDLQPEEKNTFMRMLKELPGEALKTLSNKLIEMACENPQAVWEAVKNIAS